MSTLAEKIATHHEWTPLDRCECGGWEPRKGVGPRDFIQHVAEATEAAVREQIAAQIVEQFPKSKPPNQRTVYGEGELTVYGEGMIAGMSQAALIAKGTP